MNTYDYTQIEFRRLLEVEPRAIIDLMNDPDVRRHLPLAQGHFGQEDYKRFIAGKEKIWTTHGYGPWAFMLGDEFVGWGGLQPEDGDVDVGLILRRKHWGAGRLLYTRIVDQAFNNLGVDSVIALLPPSRTRVAGLQRLGFQRDSEFVIGDALFHRYRLTRKAYLHTTKRK
ncbi:MAG: GNAT family N-acetyltransferase [Bacteroidota bacterium]